ELTAAGDDFAGVGYDAPDLVELREGLDGLGDFDLDDLVDDEGDVDFSPKHTRVSPGDVWLLGPHRLVCGDAGDPDTVRQALDGRQADLLWTDPPYGVSYVGKTSDALTIEN